MIEYDALRLYHDACKRYNTKPTYEGHKEWRDCLADIDYEEGVKALDEYTKLGYKGVPFGQTVYKLAMSARRTKTNPSLSVNPFPDKDKDNRHFLEWMANEEGKTPEEMDKYIDEFMNEWEKGNK